MLADFLELDLSRWEEKLIAAVFLSQTHSFELLGKLADSDRYPVLRAALDLLSSIDWLTAREVAIASLHSPQ
jgi:hypothetical protein